MEIFFLARLGLPGNLAIFGIIPEYFADVIPRSASDEESCCKDFSLPLEMTLWTDFERLFV
jgi:hypothetical protein